MNTEFFIAKRLLRNTDVSFATPVVRIAIFSIAVCVAVMLISLAVVLGFKQAIYEKIIGFGSHITITNFDNNSSFEATPIDKNRTFITALKAHPNIKHLQVFGIKAGVIKSKGQIQGCVLKGVDKKYDWSFFKSTLQQGNILEFNDTIKSNDILISQALADKLMIKLHDQIDLFFIQDPPRMRKFKVAGIFNSGMENFDNLYIIADIRHIQKLNDWNNNQVAGFEILLKNFNSIDQTEKDVYRMIDSDLQSKSIKTIYPQLFDWLSLIDTNGLVIVILMLSVAAITMISMLLILILERTNMIGILKAVGSSDLMIRRIFIIKALYITGSGIIWGTLVGLTCYFLQYYFHFIKLDQATYYVEYVPVYLNYLHVVTLDIATLVIGILVLLIPSFIISKIKPIKAIHYN